MNSSHTNAQQTEALAFLASQRGQFIVSKALVHAIEELEKVPSPYTEVSDIDDMKFLRDMLFPLYSILQSSVPS